MKRVGLVVLLVIIVGSVAFTIRTMTVRPERGKAVPTLVPLICEVTGKAFLMEVSVDDIPVPSPFGDGLAYRAAYCVDCGQIVPVKGELKDVECTQCPRSKVTLNVPPELLESYP